jgi:hypothetical protein
LFLKNRTHHKRSIKIKETIGVASIETNEVVASVKDACSFDRIWGVAAGSDM